MASYWLVHSALELGDLALAQTLAVKALAMTRPPPHGPTYPWHARGLSFNRDTTLARGLGIATRRGRGPVGTHMDGVESLELLDRHGVARGWRRAGPPRGARKGRGEFLPGIQPRPAGCGALAGDHSYLDEFLPWGEQPPNGPGGIFRGNLALALANAGRIDDAVRLLEVTRDHWQTPGESMNDSAKRLAWALALCGRFNAALA